MCGFTAKMSALQTDGVSSAFRAPSTVEVDGEESGLLATHKNLVQNQHQIQDCRAIATGGTPQERAKDLEELSMELYRQTQETRQLQREVELATQLTLQRFGCNLGAGPLRKHESFSQEDTSTTAFSTQTSALQPVQCPPEEERRLLGREGTDMMLEQYSLQVSALQRQLTETHELHEQQKLMLRKAITRMQTQLQESQVERDALADRSAAESQRQEHHLAELQAQLEAERYRLLEAEAQVKALQGQQDSLEQTLQDLAAVLSAHEKRCCIMTSVSLGSADVGKLSLVIAIETALKNLELEEQLEAVRQEKEQLELEKMGLVESMEQLKADHHQKLVMLQEKLRSSENSVGTLQVELQLVRKQAATQASAVQRQVSDLERSLSALHAPLLEAQRTHQHQSLQVHRLLEALECTTGLRTEGTELRRKLENKEGEVELLRAQVVGLQVERKSLSDDLQEHKLHIQHLKLALEQQESRTRGLEQQLTEKAHLLEVQHTQLAHLADEQVALRQSYEDRWAELEGTNTQLKAQLDQTKSTLRTLQGTDGQGMKVAVCMQKQITAKREQIDVLRGRVQLLQESLDKVSQEKQIQDTEQQITRQRLACMSIERQQLAVEVHTLRSQKKRLREKVENLQAALNKMSERFSKCQEHVEQREQELVRLKIHHTLHLRELQGQKCSSAPPSKDTLQAPPLPNCQQRCDQAESPVTNLCSRTQELHSVIEEDRGHCQPLHERSGSPGQHNGHNERNSTFTCPDELSSAGHSCSSSSCLSELDLGRRSPVSSLLMSTPLCPPRSYTMFAK